MSRLVLSLTFAAALLTAGFACSQNPLKLLPGNYKLVLDNADVSVIRAHYGPREKLPVHDHTSFPTVFVYLNASGPVRIDHAEAGEAPHSVTRPPTEAGAYRVAPAIAERHSIENLSDTPSDFLRIELKHVALALEEPFRGKAPASSTTDVDATEFSSPGLRIERILCVQKSRCRIQAASAPSLLVEIPSGNVRWLPSSSPAVLPGPAQVLRILFP